MEALISLVITLFAMLVSFGFAAIVILVSFSITGFMIYRAIKGGNFVIAVPAVAIPTGPPPRANHIKVSTCPSCGAGRSQPSRTAYMYCEYCGQLMDWDFRAAMSDRRSRRPGPLYEGLLKRHQPALAKAKTDSDAEAYETLQKELWQSFAKHCPAALSPRIGDARYRDVWVDWTAKSQTLQDLDSRTAATFEAQTNATGALVWDRSNPFQPMVEVSSFNGLLDAVKAHQEAVMTVITENGMLETHPDHPSTEVFSKIGLSAFVQGWMQYVPAGERDAMLEKTGLDGEYVEPEPVDLTKGTCPSCTKPLEVLPDAKRVVCDACGHMVAVKGGSLPCHGCGASIEIPEHGSDFNCPHCDLHVARIGL